jgi:hypothetical protein
MPSAVGDGDISAKQFDFSDPEGAARPVEKQT